MIKNIFFSVACVFTLILLSLNVHAHEEATYCSCWVKITTTPKPAHFPAHAVCMFSSALEKPQEAWTKDSCEQDCRKKMAEYNESSKKEFGEVEYQYSNTTPAAYNNCKATMFHLFFGGK